MSDRIIHQLASADPGRCVSESELAKSRARSVAFLQEEATTQPAALAPKESQTPRQPSPGPTLIHLPRRILLASAAAALLVGGIVVADVIPMGGKPGATSEAAEVLNDAAAATIKTSDPVVRPGQYLKIETTALYGGSSFVADGTQVFWQEKTGRQVYMPADWNDEWVQNREMNVPVGFSSEAAEAEAFKQLENTPADMVGIQRAPRGAFEGDEQTIIAGMPIGEIDSLPRNPQTLLNLIQERTRGAGKSPEIKALGTITAALRTGVIPADLRAALYKAAALIPGVTITDKQATIDGRTGIAIGIPSPEGGSSQETIIDPTTGLLIGERTVSLQDFPGTPAGAIMSWASIHTSVVDAAP